MIDAIQPQHGDKHAKDSEVTDKPKRIKYLGLSNQGATCYMNSFLQSLFMTPEFRNAIYSWEYSDKEQVKSEDCIPLQLQLLFAKLQSFKEQDYLDTKSLIRSFQWDPEESFKQHDVQEFSAVLFDAIEESFRGSKQEFFIRDLFQGSSLGYVKCRKCFNESLNEDRFLYLSLTVKDDFEKVYNPTVDKGIENYLKPFILEGDNKYFCEKCQAKVEAEKGVKFATLPKILTIHLNRFDMDYETMSRRKLNNKVTFPFTLNMNKFLKPYEEIVNEISKNPENKTIEISEVKEKKDNVNVDEEIWYNYQTEAFKMSENKGRRSKKPAVTFEDYDLSKKVMSPEPKNNNSGLNLMVSNRLDTMSVEDKSLTRTHQKAVLQETLASLKQSQKELDKKLNKLPKTNVQAPVDQSDFPAPKQQIDMDELTVLEMLLLNNASEGPKSTEDTSKSMMSNNFELSSERGTSPGKSVINEETDLITRELRQSEKEQKSLFEKFITEGDQVYELYSIMIHSGSAWGGHYYTYIKSFEDGQWYNFDDRTVIRMSVKEIEKVFGDDVPNKNNGCSAYMLMYRLYDRGQHRDGFTIEEMPKTTKEAVEAERVQEARKAEEERRKKEEKEKEIILRVFYKGGEQMVTAKKDDTFEELVSQIQKECDVTEDPQNFRLRNLSVAEGLMQDTYDEQDQKKTLDQLKFKSYKSLVVETKEADENWVGYDPNKILVKINLWRQNLFDLEENALKPKKLMGEEGSTLKALVSAIEEKFKIPADKQIIMKRNAYGGRGYTEILNRDESALDKNLNFHRIFNGLNLYVEEGAIVEGELTKWDKEFENEKHRCTIKFNNPAKDIEGQNPFYENEIIVDNRTVLIDLKKLIAEYLNIEMDTFIMKKNGRLGTELRDLKNKLIDFNIFGYVSVYLQLGTPAKSGEYKVIFCTCSLQPENNDGLNYDYVDLFSLQLGNREKVSEVKEKLVTKLAECQPPIHITPQTMRLRERNALHLGQILHDNNYMKDYSLFDNKSIVVEKLDKPTTDDPSKILIYIRYLDTEKFELSAPIEIFVPKEKTTLHGVGVETAKVLNIPIEQVECFRVQSLYSFTRTDLLTASWVMLQGNGYLLSSHPWYLIKDGYLLIIKKKDDKIDLEKVKSMKLKTNKKLLKAGEEKMPISSLPMPKETSMKIKVKKRSDITGTQDDTECGKKGDSVLDKQKRPHEV